MARHALVQLTLLLGLLSQPALAQTTVTVDNCDDLKDAIESGSDGYTETLVIELEEGDDGSIACRDGITIASEQTVRIEGQGTNTEQEIFLDSKGIAVGDSTVIGNLFTNEGGELQLVNLAFLLDVVDPLTSSTDVGSPTYGVRVVENTDGGTLTMTGCRVAGSYSVLDKAYVLGQAVNSEGDGATITISDLTYNNLSPSGSVIRVTGVSDVTVEDSIFRSGMDATPTQGFDEDSCLIYTDADVELTVTGTTFEPRAESITGGCSICCVGCTIQDCVFSGQYAPLEESGTVYSPADTSTDRELLIEDTTFEGNVADTGASAVAVYDRDLTITNSEFTGNEGTPILFVSSSATGEHQLTVEGVEFSGNYETTEGELSAYNGGSAAIVRSTGVATTTDEVVSSGTFTDTTCDTNLGSSCEIVIDKSQVTLEGSSTCVVCDGDTEGYTPSPIQPPTPAPVVAPTFPPAEQRFTPSPLRREISVPTPAPTTVAEAISGTRAPSAAGIVMTPSPLMMTLPGGTAAPSVAAGRDVVFTSSPLRQSLPEGYTLPPSAELFTSSPTATPTSAPAPIEDPVASCGSYLFTCDALKRAVETDERNGTCAFYLPVNITCQDAITVSASKDIIVHGVTPTSGEGGGVNGSSSFLSAGNGCCGGNADFAAQRESLFVVEEGGALTLMDLGFQDATTSANARNLSVRAVHNSGELYVDHCTLVGPSASDDVNQEGGAIYSVGDVLEITGSSFSEFTASRSGGAIHVEGNAPNITITSSTFMSNGALSMIPGSGGGAVRVTGGPHLVLASSAFEDNFARLGPSVLCEGATIEDTSFEGGVTQPEEQGNGGVRSVGGEGLVVTGCSFANTSAGTYAAVSPGSALEVFDSNLTLADTTFENTTGTALFMETVDPTDDGEPYYLEMDAVSFVGNVEPWGPNNGTGGLSGVAAILNATNGTEVATLENAELDLSCANNEPSECEVFTTESSNLVFSFATSCHVCDPSGATLAGAPNGSEPTFTAETGEDLKAGIESGESGTWRLMDHLTLNETIVISDGQTVIIEPGTDDSQPTISPELPFASESRGLDTDDDDATGPETFTSAPTFAPVSVAAAPGPLVTTSNSTVGSLASNDTGLSMFFVEEGGTLEVSGVTFNVSVFDQEGGGSYEYVRAIYNGGNTTVEDCDFVGGGEELADYGAAILQGDTASALTVTGSTFSDHSASASGGVIYASGMGTVEVSGCTFERNVAAGSGGCIYAGRNVTLEVEETTFLGNSAAEAGVLCACGGNLSRVAVTNSTTDETGTAAVVSGESDGDACPRNLTVTSSIFTGNTGGGLAVYNTHVDVRSTNFTGNEGTAAYIVASDEGEGFEFEIHDVIFENNTDASNWATTLATDDSVGGSDLVMRSTGGDEAVTSATMTSITCDASESGCAMVVDNDNVDVSANDIDCSVCNLDGEAIDLEAESSDDEGLSTARDGDDDGGWGWRKTLALVLPLCLLLLICCCCVAACIIWKRNGGGPVFVRRPGTETTAARGTTVVSKMHLYQPRSRRHQYKYNYSSNASINPPDNVLADDQFLETSYGEAGVGLGRDFESGATADVVTVTQSGPGEAPTVFRSETRQANRFAAPASAAGASATRSSRTKRSAAAGAGAAAATARAYATRTTTTTTTLGAPPSDAELRTDEQLRQEQDQIELDVLGSSDDESAWGVARQTNALEILDAPDATVATISATSATRGGAPQPQHGGTGMPAASAPSPARTNAGESVVSEPTTVRLGFGPRLMPQGTASFSSVDSTAIGDAEGYGAGDETGRGGRILPRPQRIAHDEE